MGAIFLFLYAGFAFKGFYSLGSNLFLLSYSSSGLISGRKTELSSLLSYKNGGK